MNDLYHCSDALPIFDCTALDRVTTSIYLKAASSSARDDGVVALWIASDQIRIRFPKPVALIDRANRFKLDRNDDLRLISRTVIGDYGD